MPDNSPNVAEPITVAAVLSEALQRIARLDAEVLLANLTRKSRAQLMAFPEQRLDPLSAMLFAASVDRRAAGEPLAYITGTREFWSRPFVVTPAVLIPRPETELLVERCLEVLGTAPRCVADLGTGSGAIALSLATERPQWRITATDLDAEALEVAAINARRFEIGNVSFSLGSWCY